MTEFNVSPLVLLMDPEPNPNAKQLPLIFYEAEVIPAANGESKSKDIFVEIPFKVLM